MSDDEVSLLTRFETCQQAVNDLENGKCDQVSFAFFFFDDHLLILSIFVGTYYKHH